MKKSNSDAPTEIWTHGEQPFIASEILITTCAMGLGLASNSLHAAMLTPVYNGKGDLFPSVDSEVQGNAPGPALLP